MPAPALHVITPRSFLDPGAALRALLEFLVHSEFHEFLIGLVPLPIGDLVLLAALPPVELSPAIQTVVLLALVACEICYPLLEEECVVALDVWAP
jgi:hypothetical protein